MTLDTNVKPPKVPEVYMCSGVPSAVVLGVSSALIGVGWISRAITCGYLGKRERKKIVALDLIDRSGESRPKRRKKLRASSHASECGMLCGMLRGTEAV
jgi:hypothetical protein